MNRRRLLVEALLADIGLQEPKISRRGFDRDDPRKTATEMAVESMHADIGASIEKRATGVQASGFLGKSDGTLEDVALITW